MGSRRQLRSVNDNPSGGLSGLAEAEHALPGPATEQWPAEVWLVFVA